MRAISENDLLTEGAVVGRRLERYRGSAMALTDELVSLSLRLEADPGPDPSRIPLSDGQLENLAERLYGESLGRPLWVFAYGSLIWKPDFDAVEWRRAGARGWHRSFCLHMTR